MKRPFLLVRSAALAVAFTLLLSPIAAAQTPVSTPPADATVQPAVLTSPAFARLIQGKKIVITTADGDQRQGIFTVSATGLTEASGPDSLVPFDQIMKVQKASSRIRNSMLIGLGSGVAIGYVAVCRTGNSHCLDIINVAGIGASGGAAIGSVLNARNRSSDVIYDAESRFLGTAGFAQLVHGNNVWITTTDGERRQGLVTAVSPTGITLGGNSTAPVPFDRMVKVQKVTHYIRNSLWIGLGAGVAHGVLGAIACGERECVALIPLVAGVGLGVGAAIGALINLGTNGGVVYDTTRRTTTVALAPILSPTRKGMAFSMTWR